MSDRQMIQQIPKNNSEAVVVSLNTFQGRQYLDIRQFWKTENGEFRPTKKGVSVSVDRLPELAAALIELQSNLENKEAV